MDKNNGKVKLNDELLDQVSGGARGDYGFVNSYLCPHCGTPNDIYRYCRSGETTRSCCDCGKQFTIVF